DDVSTWIVDDRETSPDDLIIFDFGALGGLRRWGYDMLNLYLDLQSAAGRYARAPHPQAILHNHGADLEDLEIQDLLDEWEAARETRGVGYLSDEMNYDTFGWNADELQLVQAREHAAL